VSDVTAEEVRAEMERARKIFMRGFHDGRPDGSMLRDIATALAVRAREARREALKEVEKQVGAVLAENGCDCDMEGPHEGIGCEDHGHEPCTMCQVERALNRALLGPET
jgi:hypothetical protein